MASHYHIFTCTPARFREAAAANLYAIFTLLQTWDVCCSKRCAKYTLRNILCWFHLKSSATGIISASSLMQNLVHLDSFWQLFLICWGLWFVSSFTKDGPSITVSVSLLFLNNFTGEKGENSSILLLETLFYSLPLCPHL